MQECHSQQRNANHRQDTQQLVFHHGHIAKTTTHTGPLHGKSPGYPIFRDFSEIKWISTTVCTRRSSLPLLQIGMIGYKAMLAAIYSGTRSKDREIVEKDKMKM